MALDDVESPPYPGEGVTSDGFYNALRELKKWVDFYRDDLNIALEGEFIPDLKPIPVRQVYSIQPIVAQYQQLVWMRRIREEFDHLLRTFEDEWECKPCLRARAVLVHSAASLLNDAFTPYEVREMKGRRDALAQKKFFLRVQKTVQKMLELEFSDEGQEEEGEDEDA